MQKVPLHLNFRIFETASKRLKLSEDNEDYKQSLMVAGIDSLELKDDKSLMKREWKEVQLKISETGVMSITDISNTMHKRDTEVENLQNEKTSGKETITSIAEIKSDLTKIENCGISKSSVEIMPSTLIIDAQMTKNPIFSDSSNAFLVTSDIKFTSDNLSTNSNCMSLTNQHNGTTTRQTNEMRNCPASAKLQQDAQEVKIHNQNVKVEDKSETVLQERKSIGRSATQFTEENVIVIEDKEKMDAHAKKVSINNNNADFQAETRKECIKSSNEAKIGSAGSKIDALSAKLQFQPKMGQVNNTYSKRAPKEKRVTFQQSTKKSDIKSSTEDAKLTDTKAQTNCGNITNKVLVSTATPSQKSTVSTVASQNISDSSDSSGSDKQKDKKDNQSISIDLQQALNLLEQKNSPVQTSIESVPKTSHVANTVNQKLQNNNITAMNDNIASTVANISTSTISQTTPTFPYALHDIVTNAAVLKSALKNSSSSVPQKPLGTSPIACSTSNNQMSPLPQFNMQTSSTMYSIPTSLKNNYGNVSQDGTIVMTPSIATITTTAMSKPISTSACPIPPCPDAIPISLMKQMSMRKQDVTAKGTNLNEICAKIGSNTIGSKINDICAKIGENSKEKNRMDTHGKSDVPDLLRISAKKNPSPLVSNSDTAIKHIPNIPNIPVYTPSSNATTMESKSAKPVLLTSASALAVSTSPVLAPSHMTQRLAPLKKQSQSVGYKTLRDPPKSWNPTLSKNNYVAAKNQAKEMQNQTQTSMSEGTNKQIPSKPAKIFKMRNVPRYLGNPASGVKPMYGVTDTKEKEQSTANAKNATLNMMKIDPKTLASVVSTINSPIVSPPPYSPNVRSYQNTPFSRDICRNTGSPISPRNSPVNMLSTNPFIPSPTPNTNPRIIYSHFPPPFSDANRFPNPLIRSPIGIPPPSAFHSSLPPSINKLYQRSSYIPQTAYASVVGQPPTVQRIPPSTHSSSPKSPKVSSPSSISSTSFNLGKAESQSPITSTVDSVALLFSKGVAVPVSMPVPVSVSLQRELDAFNLSKTGGLSPSPTSNVVKTSPTNDVNVEAQLAKSNSSMNSLNLPAITTSVETSKNSMVPNSINERKQDKETEVRKAQEATRCKEDNSKAKPTETKCSVETTDNTASLHDKREKNQAAKINGDVITEQFTSKKSKEDGSNETATTAETTERDGQIERSSSKEQNSIPKNNTQVNINDSKPADDSKNEDLGKGGEQIQGNKSEVQKNKAET